MHHKKKIIRNTLIGIITVIFIALAIIGNYMVNFAIRPGSGASESIGESLVEYASPEQRQIEEAAEATEKRVRERADQWVASTDHGTVSITSGDGLQLKAVEFRQENDSHLWSIVVHGYNNSWDTMKDYAQKYYERGYHVLAPDLRAMGSSEGEYIGMGWLDRLDLMLWIDRIVAEDPEAQIVLHGISMGAATIMMTVGEDIPSNVKVCVEDCGYTSDWDEQADKLDKLFHLPEFPLMYTVNIMTKLKAGYYITDADCIPQLQKNKTPMLFIHGDMDDYNPYWMLDVVYEANACTEKEKLVVHGARHAMSVYTEPEVYWNTVWKFIDKYTD
ncbi:MAG: alpha/beta fold hydrolase [Lachnospiraceae bacterium]|nr:alpha/beta fold hydrolase [Lachnospiraceae bacterium]